MANQDDIHKSDVYPGFLNQDRAVSHESGQDREKIGSGSFKIYIF